MSDPSIPVEPTDTSLSDSEPAALIGLGRRGCAAIRHLRKILDVESLAFFFGDDPAACIDDSGGGEGTNGFSPPAPAPDLAVCSFMGVLVVGADYHDPGAVRRLRRELERKQPALLLGIVLPPLPGEPVRLDPRLRAAWDCAIDWPSDPETPADASRLALTVSDWLSPVLSGGIVCIDIADLLILVSCGRSPVLRVGSATAAHDQPLTAAQRALTDLYGRGFTLDECGGMLVVIRVGFKFTIGQYEAIGEVFQALPLPEPFVLSLSCPVDPACIERDLVRVTVFAVCPSPGVCAT